MVAMTLHLPEELCQLAEVAAQSRGMSLDEFVCDSLKAIARPNCPIRMRSLRTEPYLTATLRRSF